ncbi:unnamed protein product [Paramecium sonneborni]|uniref:FPL domain-containing protein n=1 Tax=Paramecium sonneborni TaxID=65129 RepID=A0A8S1NW45_9CILI|nr:unnamed protein product [Paramecium sonneborni]
MSKQPPLQSDPDTLVEAYEQLNQKIQLNNYDVVDQIGQICQSIMWGDKNNDTFFDYFCDQKTMSLYLDLVHSGQREVVVAVIKTITMLLQNIQRPVSINYILSHSALNGIIIADYNFRDDEIIAYYINLLKCVSIRIDEQSLQLFYNLKFSTFPMLMKAIGFYKHKENLIRTSVRNIVLGITKINLPQLRRYVRSFPFALFYVQFSCYMRDALFYIGGLIQEGRQESHKIIKLLLDDQLDILYFLEDLLKTNLDALPIIVNSIMVYGFVPTIVMGIIKSGQQQQQQSMKQNQLPQRQSMNQQQSQKYQHNRGQSLGNITFTSIFTSSQSTNNQQNQQVIDIKFCLFILIQIYKSFSFSQFLDLLTLFILGKDPEIIDFITQLNTNSKLNSYEKDISMSETWIQKEKIFIQAYSQFIYKDCEISEDVNVNDKDELLRGVSSYETQSIKRELNCEHFKTLINDSKRYDDLLNITDLCDITIVKSQFKNKTSALSFMEKNEKSKINGNTTINDKTPFYALMKHLESNDDTVVFMVLLFIKTLRHSKNISHSVLEQIGMITPDKNMELYKNCQETQYFMQDKLLNILEIGLPPYRLGTYILSIQMLIDFCRTDLESYDLHYKDRFRNIVLNHIQKINEYIKNHLEMHYVIEFFYTDYKVLNKTSISIWPQTHIQLLYEMTQKGVCQIDIKHNESIYFMEPVKQQDKIRKDMMILLILKYTTSVFFGFQEQEQQILDNPKPFGDGPALKYQSDNVYNLEEEPYCQFIKHLCKYQNIDACILEDSNCLVVMDLMQGLNAAKCIISYSLKNTDEMVERLNLKMLHVTYRFENQNNVFDLEFPNKQACQAAKKMTEQKKTALKIQELDTITKYLQALTNTLNYNK